MSSRKKQREKRIKQGLCADCGKNPLTSKRLCIDCLEISRKARKKHDEKVKNQKQDLIDAGKCTKCIKREICSSRSKILCSICLDRAATSSKKAAVKRRERRKENKECVGCGKKLTTSTLKQLCDRCSSQQAISKKNWVEKIKEHNLCRDCGLLKENLNRSKCNNCLNKDKERSTQRQSELINRDICARCGRNRIREGSKWLCDSCLQVSKEKTRNKKQEFLLSGCCYTCGREKESSSSICKLCREYTAKKHLDLKNRVILKYGDSCSCCDYKHNSFLTIDHIYNDGATEREIYGSGSGFYGYLDKNPTMKDRYQVLCFNCNIGKARNYNICPHLDALTDFNSIHYKRKKLILNKYGDKCNCCQEDNILFLTIDHINGGGTNHKKTLTANFYCWLIKENYPKGYQTLCQNCNWSKYLNKVCVHNSVSIFDLINI